MSEHYYVHNGFKADIPCKWVTRTTEVLDRGRNYLLFRVSPSSTGGTNIATLDNIDADGHGRGSVLLASMAHDAMMLNALSLTGMFEPRGVRERIRTWYEHHGIEIDMDNQLFGQLSVVYAMSMAILAKHGTTFEVL